MKLSKKLVKTFGACKFKIEAVVNVEKVQFLDVEFNINTREYKPFKKPNDWPIYVNKQSNHPPAVIKTLPENINTRISKLTFSRRELCMFVLVETDITILYEAF